MTRDLFAVTIGMCLNSLSQGHGATNYAIIAGVCLAACLFAYVRVRRADRQVRARLCPGWPDPCPHCAGRVTARCFWVEVHLRQGGHRFFEGACACGQKTADDPIKCAKYGGAL